MLKVTGLGIAAAFVIGSASLALAETPESGWLATPPNAATIYQDGVVVRQPAPRSERRQSQHSGQNTSSDRSLNNSFDGDNTSGGS